MKTAPLAQLYGLPQACCAELCAALAEAGWLYQDDDGGWLARPLATADDDAATRFSTHETAAAGGQLDGLDKTNARLCIHGGEETRQLHANACVVQDAQRPPADLIGLNWDATESCQAREHIARREAQLRGAFEIAPNGMALVDAAGRWLQVNQALCAILGYSADELLARDFQSISHPEDLAADLRYLDDLVSGRSDELHFEKRYIHKDGHSIPVLLSASAVRDEQGNLSFVVVHVLDLTERRGNEAAMLAAKEAAESANRAKGEFLANMSHEIRTPLNAMIGLTDLTLSTALDRQQREHLEKVRQSSGALLSIVNDILDFSKIEAGQVALDPRPFRLRDLLDQLTALFQAAVEEKGLNLVYRIAPEVPQDLVGDPTRLGQVLNNLVGNAVKFTEQGHVAIAISVEDEREQRIRLRFVVEDTGIGIARGTADRLFDAFTQADGSITRRYGGTGLGLSISQRLVRMMGGRIEVESTEGRGSRFQFGAELQIPGTAAARIGAAPDGLAQARILLVDKEPLSGEMLSALLRSWQVSLVTAGDCAEAHRHITDAAAAGTPIELVLLDAQHCLNCRTCAVAAGSVQDRSPPPRVFGEPPTPLVRMVTNLEQRQLLDRNPGLALPCLLSKPITPSGLLAAISSVRPNAPIRPTGAEPDRQTGRAAATPGVAWIDPRVLSELRRSIADNDYIPSELVASLRAHANPSAWAALNRIEEALTRFDYDAAAEALDELPAAASSAIAAKAQPAVPPATAHE